MSKHPHPYVESYVVHVCQTCGKFSSDGIHAESSATVSAGAQKLPEPIPVTGCTCSHSASHNLSPHTACMEEDCEQVDRCEFCLSLESRVRELEAVSERHLVLETQLHHVSTQLRVAVDMNGENAVRIAELEAENQRFEYANNLLKHQMGETQRIHNQQLNEMSEDRDEWKRCAELLKAEGEAFEKDRQAQIDALNELLKMAEEALSGLIRCNEEWNAAVQTVIGKPAGWNDEYLNAAREALAKIQGGD